MPQLSFQVESADVLAFSVAPCLAFRLRVTNAIAGERIQSIALQCQIRIEPGRRGYQPAEQDRLGDLFGTPERWGQTLRPLLWTHCQVNVPGFGGAQTVELPVPCTFDFNVAATQYFNGLEAGEAPLLLLFSGTVFFENAAGELQASQIPWSCEAAFRLPVGLWRQMMDHYYPGTAWLCLQRAAFERLQRYKSQRGLLTWEQTVESLLDEQAAAHADAAHLT